MIYDGFLINDELDLLELRLMETYDLVDKYILVEAPCTFRCNPSPLHYNDNKERFEKWADKIVHIVADDIPVEPHPVTEFAQRNAIARGWADATSADVVIVSDVDEIMSRSALKRLRQYPPLYPVSLQQKLYYYNVHFMQADPWYGPVATMGTDVPPQELRDERNRLQSLPSGGWHFSWFGSVEQIASKMDCIDVERDSRLHKQSRPMDCDRDRKHISECVSTGKDLFHRTEDMFQKRRVNLSPGKGHPSTIVEWLEKHPEYAHS